MQRREASGWSGTTAMKFAIALALGTLCWPRTHAEQLVAGLVPQPSSAKPSAHGREGSRVWVWGVEGKSWKFHHTRGEQKAATSAQLTAISRLVGRDLSILNSNPHCQNKETTPNTVKQCKREQTYLIPYPSGYSSTAAWQLPWQGNWPEPCSPKGTGYPQAVAWRGGSWLCVLWCSQARSPQLHRACATRQRCHPVPRWWEVASSQPVPLDAWPQLRLCAAASSNRVELQPRAHRVPGRAKGFHSCAAGASYHFRNSGGSSIWAATFLTPSRRMPPCYPGRATRSVVCQDSDQEESSALLHPAESDLLFSPCFPRAQHARRAFPAAVKHLHRFRLHQISLPSAGLEEVGTLARKPAGKPRQSTFRLPCLPAAPGWRLMKPRDWNLRTDHYRSHKPFWATTACNSHSRLVCLSLLPCNAVQGCCMPSCLLSIRNIPALEARH